MTPTEPRVNTYRRTEVEECTCTDLRCDLSHPQRVDLATIPNRQQRRKQHRELMKRLKKVGAIKHG